jgi:transcriptional regulator with XRE-family HTH domain
MNIGDRVKNIRQQMKISRKAFSELTGISVSYLSEIEHGIKHPTVETILKITKAFNMTVSELLGETAALPINPELKELIETLRDFKPEQIKLLNQFLKTLK